MREHSGVNMEYKYPVKHLSWYITKPKIRFMRYPALVYDIPENILVRSLLGMLKIVAYKYNTGNAILNDAWRIKLRKTK